MPEICGLNDGSWSTQDVSEVLPQPKLLPGCLAIRISQDDST